MRGGSRALLCAWAILSLGCAGTIREAVRAELALRHEEDRSQRMAQADGDVDQSQRNYERGVLLLDALARVIRETKYWIGGSAAAYMMVRVAIEWSRRRLRSP